MKRSRAVRLTLVASASACAGPAPAPQQTLHCVDRGSNRVVADSLCEAARLAANGGPSGSFGDAAGGASGEFGADTAPRRGAVAAGGADRGAYDGGYRSGPLLSPFLWYYGGRVASGFASAGSYEPVEGARYRSPSGYTATGSARRGFFARAFGGRGSAGRASAGRGAVARGGFGSTGAARGGGHGA